MAATIVPGINLLNVYIDHPVDTDGVTLRDDLIGVKVWYSKTDAFNITDIGVVLGYDGTLLDVQLVSLENNTTYYIRYALISEIEPSNYIVSPIYSGTTINTLTIYEDLTPPVPPSNLTISEGYATLTLNWSAPTYTTGGGPLNTLVYAAKQVTTSSPTITEAILVGTTDGTNYIFSADAGETWLFWIKNQSKGLGISDTTGPVSGTTSINIPATISSLSGQIGATELNTALTSRINLIDVGSNSIISNITALSASIQSEQDSRISADSTLSSRTTTLESAVNNPTTGLTTKASISYVDTAKSDAISAAAATTAQVNARLNTGGDTYIALTNVTNTASTKSATFVQSTTPTATRINDLWIDTGNSNLLKRWTGTAWVTADDQRIGSTASSVTTLQSQMTGSTGSTLLTSIQTEASTRVLQTNQLFAQYTVKIDTAGNVAGYGLASTTVNGIPKSAFGIRADSFWVAPPVSYTQATAPTANSWGTVSVRTAYAGLALLACGDSGNTVLGNSAGTWVRPQDTQTPALDANGNPTGSMVTPAYLSSTGFGTASVRCSIYAQGIYVVAGTLGKVATSIDGQNWIYRSELSATSWGTATVTGIIYVNGKFYIVGDNGRVAIGIYTAGTPGSFAWTNTSSLSSAWSGSTASGIRYVRNTFVAFGAAGKLAYSIDGITWINLPGSVTAMGSNTITSLLDTGNSIGYLIVGTGGKVATATDATIWTAQTSLSSTSWGTADINVLLTDGTIFLVAGALGKVATSLDGITWVYRPGLSTTSWGTTNVNTGVYTDGKFTLFGDSGKVATSYDGITWTYSNALSIAGPIGEDTIWVDTSVTPNVTKYYVRGTWTSVSPSLPFIIQSTPDILDGIPISSGVYIDAAYIKNGTITNAKIGNASIDDAKITSLNASKLTVGDGTVGGNLKSSNYIAGSAGWIIQPNGYAEYNNVVVRGTVIAGQTDFNTGIGAWVGSDGRFSVGNGSSSTNYFTFDGTGLHIRTSSINLGDTTTNNLSLGLGAGVGYVNNTSIGVSAGSNFTGNANSTHNLVIGSNAAAVYSYIGGGRGSLNTVIGAMAGGKLGFIDGGSAPSGSLESYGNALFGYFSGGHISTGSNNICIGNGAGRNITTGSNNLVLGGYAANTTDTDLIYIATGIGDLRIKVDSTGGFSTSIANISSFIYPDYSIRAWVNFSVSGGTPAIRASGNISVIVDSGVGDYTIYFTQYMPDSNYAVCGMSNRVDNAVGPMMVSRHYGNGTDYLNYINIDHVRVTVNNVANTAVDSDFVSVCIIR